VRPKNASANADLRLDADTRVLIADHLQLTGADRRERFLSGRHQRAQRFKTIIYCLKN
jgi:hypothetical protein